MNYSGSIEMAKTKVFLCAGLFLVLIGLSAGCVKVDAKAPDNVSWGSPQPTASIPQANPTDKADLLRENQQLRDRVAWLEGQNRRSAGKSKDLAGDKQDIQADMVKISAERDRYKRAVGQ
jgi:hypothetical protein